MTQTCHSSILLLVAMVCRVGGGGGVSVDSECHTCHHSPPTSQHTFTRHSGSYFYIVTNIENTYILSLEKWKHTKHWLTIILGYFESLMKLTLIFPFKRLISSVAKKWERTHTSHLKCACVAVCLVSVEVPPLQFPDKENSGWCGVWCWVLQCGAPPATVTSWSSPAKTGLHSPAQPSHQPLELPTIFREHFYDILRRLLLGGLLLLERFHFHTWN